MRVALFVGLLLISSASAQDLDVVIAHGRVIDPETGLDAARNVGIKHGKIAAITERELSARSTVDAAGLVVAPGFIDIHQHGQTEENYALKARDGVTTALEMEVGVGSVSSWYGQREGKSLINYGASVGHVPVRMAVLHDTGNFLPRDKAIDTALSPNQMEELFRLLRTGLNEGALGIGMGVAYTPGASAKEIYDVFELGASRQVPVFVHLRSAGPVYPGGLSALQEVMADAAATGCSLHVVHITSTELRDTHLALRMLESARHRGLDFTTEAYPYTAGMTEIESAIFSPGWEARNGGITFGDLQWAATGERLTKESFERFRREGGMVAIHSIPEEVAREALADPEVLVASDGILENGKGHPRASGTYARVLGKYVRDEHVLTLTAAIRKMTLLPALRIGLPGKGRLQVGADADITIFDPNRVADRATYQNPGEPSVGIPYVMVNGTWVVQQGRVVDAVRPGQGLRH
jgi:N-acyl-D-aspartate/D-glutamate deacylase